MRAGSWCCKSKQRDNSLTYGRIYTNGSAKLDDELLSQIFAEIGELKGVMSGVLDALNDGKDRVDRIEKAEIQISKKLDDRIRLVEQQQQSMNGKLAAFVMVIGGGSTIIINLIIYLWDKTWK